MRTRLTLSALFVALTYNCQGQAQATPSPIQQATVSPTDQETPLPTDEAAPPPTDQDGRANPVEDSRDRIFYPGDTERPIPLGRKLVLNVLLDQKEIWTSPFHMHAKDAKWWIGFGAATAALISTDHRTSNIFENSSGSGS